LSRTTCPENLKILLSDHESDLRSTTQNTTPNVVYPEILLD
jgi:hypothetical protein